MTLHNANAATVILALLATGGAILYITKRLADWRAASKRSDEAWSKFTWGDWV